ncbi:DUF86 domain-containing protein [Candidatus Bathyarchaeota archaeon]|nr:DUF86 domain-containing protein [Candidatus Bathyarchaeota archaeon]
MQKSLERDDGTRDKLIHEYLGVDLKKVWKTIKEDIPKLKLLFEEIVGNYKPKQA